MIGLVGRLALPLALEEYPGFGSYEGIGPMCAGAALVSFELADRDSKQSGGAEQDRLLGGAQLLVGGEQLALGLGAIRPSSESK